MFILKRALIVNCTKAKRNDHPLSVKYVLNWQHIFFCPPLVKLDVFSFQMYLHMVLHAQKYYPTVLQKKDENTMSVSK